MSGIVVVWNVANGKMDDIFEAFLKNFGSNVAESAVFIAASKVAEMVFEEMQ